MRVKTDNYCVVRIALVLVVCQCFRLGAGEIDGTVIVKRRLTRRTITAPALNYERGISVPLAPGAAGDPLAYERTHVVVYLEGSEAHAGQIRAPRTMGQRNRQFEPDLLAVAAGSPVSFPNFDPIFHNVFSLSKPKSFDLGNYSRGQTRNVAFPKPGIVLVGCRIHVNMAAIIVVTPNAWNAVPDTDGHFQIQGVPSGKYTLVAWHKSAGLLRREVTVEANSPTRVELLVPLDENGAIAKSTAEK